MEQVKLLSMTAMLSLVIWLGADSLVNETVNLEVALTLKPESAESSMLVEPVSGRAIVELNVYGPRRIVEDLRQGGRLEATLRVSDRPTGPASITLTPEAMSRELNIQIRDFSKLSIVTVRPQTLEARIDHLVEHEADIVLRNLTLPYETEPQVGPASVVANMRESRFQEWQAAGRAVELDLSSEVDRQFQERERGENHQVTIKLDPREFGPNATFKPATVQVTAVVQARRDLREIPTVPIMVAVSFDKLGRAFRPVATDGTPLELVTRTIVVEGPTDVVARLARGEIRAFGVIRLREEDLDDPDSVKVIKPEIFLPPGISQVGTVEPVELKLVPVSAEIPIEP